MTDEADRKEGDPELDRYLAGGSRLSTRYRAASSEATAPELDRAVLEHARAAVRPSVTAAPPPRRRSWQQRWAVPVGIAATLLVGVDLAWRVADQSRTEQTLVGSAAQLASKRAERDAPAAAPAPSEPRNRMLYNAPGAATRADQAPAEQAVADEAREAYESHMQVHDQDLMAADPATSSADVSTEGSGFEAEDSVIAAAPPAGEAYLEAEAAPAEDAEVAAAEQALRAARARATERRESQAKMQAMAAPAVQVEPPMPRRSAVSARATAEDVANLLRTRDFDALRSRYAAAALTRQALESAAEVLQGSLNLRLVEDADGSWRADYLDVEEQMRCALRLQPQDDGWRLVGLATRP